MYEVTVLKKSREFTAREIIALRDMSRHTHTEKGMQIDNVKDYILFRVNNDLAQNAEYEQLVIITETGTYYTGSSSFIADFIDIYEAVHGDGEPISVLVSAQPSKNYNGNEFYKCYLVV